MVFFDFLFKGHERRYKKYLTGTVRKILEIEKDFEKLSLSDIPKKTDEFKARFQEGVKKEIEEKVNTKTDLEKAKLTGESEKIKSARFRLNEGHEAYVNKEKEVLDTLLPEAYALVKTACKLLMGTSWEVRGKQKEWYMIPFDVQLEGAIVLHDGKIAEMKTGEGKTLVCTMPLYLHALTGRGCHLVTVNEYLAQRDMEWMSRIYEVLGLSVGVVIHELSPPQRKEEYGKDITYCTNNELGFDYLRDNMAQTPETMVQRDLAYCVVDEVDSILIDEARTPLIISSPGDEATDKYVRYSGLVPKLKKEHYAIDEKQKTAVLTEEGIKHMEELLGVQNIYTESGVSEVHHIEQALKANIIFQKDKDYVVNDGQIVIVDEFTGRLMPGRRYSEGLHQALEAKEGVQIQRESRTLATITFQNFFRLYDSLAGMTGTAKTEEEEFQKIYGLEVQIISTKNLIIRMDKPDAIFKNIDGKFTAITRLVKDKREAGQPCLVGTVSIEKSEVLSDYFKKAGIPHNVLNAKQHEKEADIVARAGENGSITIATNMAGRGTDIKITDEVKEVGGLCVIGSERHESRRIDNQLRGRSGRLGDPGESQFFVSMEDDIMRIFGGDRIGSIMKTLRVPDDQAIENRMISGSLEKAQKRVEGHHFDMRKHVVEYDNIMSKHREILYTRRRDILFSDSATGTIKEFFKNFATKIATFHTAGRAKRDFEIEALAEKLVPLLPDTKEDLIKELDEEETTEQISEKLIEKISNFYENKWSNVPEEERKRIEKSICLQVVDMLWMQHIDDMVRLREHVAYRGYAQKDPLGEYRREAYEMFEKLLGNIEATAVQTLCQIELVATTPEQLEKETPPQETNEEEIEKALDTDEFDIEEEPEEDEITIIKADEPDPEPEVEIEHEPETKPTLPPEPKIEPKPPTQAPPPPPQGLNKKGITVFKAQDNKQNSMVVEEKKYDAGRNDPCPCGSGKKFKKCCGR